MLRIKNLGFGILVLLLMVNTCSAAVELTVTPVNGNTVAPGGTISYYVNISSTEDQTEKLEINTSDKLPDWDYDFNPDTLTLTSQGDLNTSILTITVPSTAAIGNYYHVLIAFGYIDYEGIEILVGKDESGFNTNVQVPEFPTVVVPMVAILGLVAIIGRRKE